ncbi:MAG: GNAT family N-acetyltransferase [Bacteroidetes bacterium]|nr:GNAT family N-acetyltransferase [Bacteroidota bacterium]
MSGNLEIRRAYASDMEVLRALSIQTFSETFSADNTKENMERYLSEAFNEEALLREIRQPDTLFFLAFENALPVGYLKLRVDAPHDGLKPVPAMELERIYVLKTHQQKHIGAGLLAYSQELALSFGCVALWLGVWEHNLKARGFYESKGFANFGSHVFMLGTDPQTDLLMVKYLSE